MRDLSSFIDPLIGAFRRRGTFLPGPALPATVEEAYAVHSALIEALGPVGGFKISQRPGQAPMVAPIPETRCSPTGADVLTPAVFGVELEVGFVIVEPLPDPDTPDYRRRLLAAVRPAPMIELVSSRLEGPAAADPVAKLADLQACEALICGATLEKWTGLDFDTPAIAFHGDGRPLHTGTGKVPGGSAIAALEATVRVVGNRFGGLKPGHKVLTGTLVPLTPVRAPQTVTGRIETLGEVAVSV